MSATSGKTRRFYGDWEYFLEDQAEEVRAKTPPSDSATQEEIDMDARGVDELQEADMMGSEAEHIGERVDENGSHALKREFTRRHMDAISEHVNASGHDTIHTGNNNEISKVDLDFGNYSGTSEFDVGASEKEDVTGLVRSIDDIVRNLDLVEQVTAETNPDDDVVFRRQGHLTEMMMRGSEGAFDWDNAEAGIYPGTEFISGAPRYFAFDDTYDGVMQVAGTGSIQTTMRPKIYDEEHEGETDPDKWIKDFSGGGDRVGMHALSPLIYGPFQASPVIGERETEEGKTEKFIEVLNGRDKAYGQGFQNEHDTKGLGKSEEEYVTEKSKAGYSPELAEIEGMEDAVDFPADTEWTFSNAVQAGKMKVVEEGETYESKEEYDTLDEDSFLDSDDIGLIRVGHEDWDLDGGRNTIKMKEFPEHERFEGTVYIVDEDGNRERKRVVVDYQDEELFPDMDDEKFMNTVKDHYEADATAVWESWRMRPDKPAIEYRDMCNNPFRDAGIATQVGAFRRWRELQEFAEEELGIYEEDAQDLRLGVNGMQEDPEDENYQDNVGLDYTVNEEKGISLQDAWTGNHEDLSRGMIDIIAEGVDEMTTGEAYSAGKYRETVTELAENGLTPGEMMAKEKGVEMGGEILYEPEDAIVGDEQYAS